MYDLFCNALYFLTVCWDYFNKMFFFKYICVLINIYIYTGVQLGGCLDGMPSPFTIPIKEPRTINRLEKQIFCWDQYEVEMKSGNTSLSQKPLEIIMISGEK